MEKRGVQDGSRTPKCKYIKRHTCNDITIWREKNVMVFGKV